MAFLDLEILMNLPEVSCLQSKGSLSVKKTIKVITILKLTSKFILGKTLRSQKVIKYFLFSIRIFSNCASFPVAS